MKPLVPMMLLGCAHAIAQQTFTAPPGLSAVESKAPAVYTTHPFYAANARFQYSCGDVKGSARPNINKLELRRDGEVPTGVYPARTTNLALLLAHTSLATAGTTFASNYAGVPTAVVTRKQFSLPDHGQAPVLAPAPWSIAIPFDSGSSFSYDGVQDLLWEMQCDGTTPVNVSYSLDSADVGVAGGTGSLRYVDPFGNCVTPNGSFWIFGKVPVTSATGSCTLANWATGGPTSAAAAWLIGASDPNLQNLLCAPLRSSAEVTLGYTTTATGDIGSAVAPLAVTFTLPVRLSVWTQFAAFDPTQTGLPFALSDAAQHEFVPFVTPLVVSRLSATSAVTPPSGMASGVRYDYFVPVARFTH